MLPWGAVLANGERAADLSGHLCRVAVTYDPDEMTFEIDDPLPAGFTYVSSNPTANVHPLVGVNGTVSWTGLTFPTSGVGQTQTFTINATATAPGPATNTATACTT